MFLYSIPILAYVAKLVRLLRIKMIRGNHSLYDILTWVTFFVVALNRFTKIISPLLKVPSKLSYFGMHGYLLNILCG